MIQRIQTVYMLASVIAILMLLLLPLATFLVPEATYELNALGIRSLTEGNTTEVMGWSIFLLLLIMLVTPLICIFLYKKRWLQLRFLIFSGVLDLLYYGLYFYECHNYESMIGAWTEAGTVEVIYNYMLLAMPALSLFCNVMAMRGVIHDIALLKSLERLR